ncbi:hypothetical protein BJ742DRAFT_744453 [Cladochytrium replicatum]|nr:hypothetical protein BJ742DRAFT_744453 [Cladochytrium replicatum]
MSRLDDVAYKMGFLKLAQIPKPTTPKSKTASTPPWLRESNKKISPKQTSQQPRKNIESEGRRWASSFRAVQSAGRAGSHLCQQRFHITIGPFAESPLLRPFSSSSSLFKKNADLVDVDAQPQKEFDNAITNNGATAVSAMDEEARFSDDQSVAKSFPVRSLAGCWDSEEAHDAFFAGHRPLLSDSAFPGGVDAELGQPVGGYQGHYYKSAVVFVKEVHESAEESKRIRNQSTNDPPTSVQVDILGRNTVPGDRIFSSWAEYVRYHDEYAKIFNTFTPFSPPPTVDLSSLHKNAVNTAMATQQPSTTSQTPSNNSPQPVSEEEFSILLVSSDRQHIPVDVPKAPNEGMHAISIQKRRKKKMNKHKWKKRRKAVRDSTRYNPERRRKGGIVREKQE